ncbi:hypothetical protein FQK23_03185 [Corynebacterium aurimucosum]|uniref:Uncharacterized protein n=1 Tax=Corynebacterium aurimucosum TaxID=169292 RepID=A0A558GK14_9CORY|nr:hypothetical protein HMPREF2781_03605 [Corynebacterium sp. HMSC062A03]OFS40540.1 hypothetical protein HMPREF2896_03665 [Corynebacterium sp. HMSC069E04]TVU57229.1 hypothetical protein FQK23_03185 [Corynebacterium aurimucosum]
MPHNDFDEFARGFRERTAARLLEFEKAMAKAQDELEKSAQRAAQAQSPTEAQRRNPASRSGAHSQSQRQGRGRPRGQVQSVLRRG